MLIFSEAGRNNLVIDSVDQLTNTLDVTVDVGMAAEIAGDINVEKAVDITESGNNDGVYAVDGDVIVGEGDDVLVSIVPRFKGDIIGVDQGAKKFTVDGNLAKTKYLKRNVLSNVQGSTGNNALYRVKAWEIVPEPSATDGYRTVVEVFENIANGVADGTFQWAIPDENAPKGKLVYFTDNGSFKVSETETNEYKVIAKDTCYTQKRDNSGIAGGTAAGVVSSMTNNADMSTFVFGQVLKPDNVSLDDAIEKVGSLITT